MKVILTFILLLICSISNVDASFQKDILIHNMIQDQRQRNLNFNLKYYKGMLTELECLSLAVYHEARGEGTLGIKAVAYVIHNRVWYSRKIQQQGKQEVPWGTTYCETVYQDRQFSFINDQINDSILYFDVYEKIIRICYDLLYNGGFALNKSPVGRSYYFHSLETPEDWRYYDQYEFVATIGNHHFFTFK